MAATLLPERVPGNAAAHKKEFCQIFMDLVYQEK